LSRNVIEHAFSVLRIAAVLGAYVVVIAHFRSVHTLSVIDVAGVLGAGIVVIADNRSEHTLSSGSVTGIGGAGVVVIAEDRCLFAVSSGGIALAREAQVSCAVLGSVDTSVGGVTGVDGARIAVIANNWGFNQVTGLRVAVVLVAFVLLLHGRQVEFGRIDASFLSIASVLGARVVVTAGHRSVHTLSAGLVASVSGAGIVIIANNSHVGADSSGGITGVDSARVVVVAVLVDLVVSVLGVAQVDDTFVWTVWNRDGRIHTSSSLASVGSANIVVVTSHWQVLAASGRSAGIDGASVVVVARDRSVDTSFHSIAGVSSALVVVIARDRSVDTVSTGGIAGVSSAYVVVIAVFRNLEEPLGQSTSPDLALVGVLCIHLVQIDRSDHTSFNNIASLDGAGVSIVTFQSLVFASSAHRIARIEGASVVVIAVLWSEHTAAVSLAVIDGARVVIIASLWCINTSSDWIAAVDCASVSVTARFWSVHTQSVAEVAEVGGAGVVVVTNNGSFDTFSAGGITLADSAFVACSAGDWHVAANSVAAGIDGTGIVVVTGDSSVHTTGGWVATCSAAFVAVVAIDGFVNNS